jgi:hypothetical protein
VCAINREYLKVIAIGVPHPAGDFRSVSVQRLCARVTIRREARFAGGKVID